MISSSRSGDGLRIPAALLCSAASVALLLALAVCADATGPGQAADTGDQIYFVSTRAGELSEFGLAQRDIYRMNADGSDAQRLTTQGSAYKDLQLSPDGTRIALCADLGACYDIWVVNLDGTGLTQLTGVAGYERCNEMPEWSPDGAKIAFISSRHPAARCWPRVTGKGTGSCTS
jgi:Tol biopolymer transport system component